MDGRDYGDDVALPGEVLGRPDSYFFAPAPPAPPPAPEPRNVLADLTRGLPPGSVVTVRVETPREPGRG